MNCRPHCGACCIAPAITRPFWGMPEGKPAGRVCAHLLSDARCGLFDDPRRPAVCEQFQPERSTCGDSRDEALSLLGALERDTAS